MSKLGLILPRSCMAATRTVKGRGGDDQEAHKKCEDFVDSGVIKAGNGRHLHQQINNASLYGKQTCILYGL